MVSLQLMNVIINATMWFAQGFIVRVMESIYVSISKLQLRYTGATRATDSSELDIFKWIPIRRNLHTNADQKGGNGTAFWVFVLILLSLCFLPAELLVETGIDERKDCVPLAEIQVGICATPWMGQSELLAATSAMLVQLFSWVDSDWDVVYEGSNPSLNGNEVHREHVVSQHFSDGKPTPLASDCRVTVSNCTDCGTMSVGKDHGGPFNIIVSNASLGETQLDEEGIEKKCPHVKDVTGRYRPYHGDLTYDFVTGMAFFFWSLPCEKLGEKERPIYTIRTRGVEAILTKREIEKSNEPQGNPWTILLNGDRTRMYDISCNSPGLGWKDLMKAVSLYRTVQLGQPGLIRLAANSQLSRVPPIERSDVLKALLAIKAQDIRSSLCERLVPIYCHCGAFQWGRAGVLLGLCLSLIVMWIFLVLLSSRYPAVHVPFNPDSWRSIALKGDGKIEQILQFEQEDGHIVVRSIVPL